MAPFPIRGLNLVESVLRHSPDQLRRFIRRMKELRLNTLIVPSDYGWQRYRDLILEETAAAGIEVCLMVFAPRSFLRFVDWQPAWLAKKPDGTPLTAGLECNTKLCAAQPAALEGFAEGAKRWLAELPPGIRHVHLRNGDGLASCECPACRPLSPEDRWQPFVNAFARVIADQRPDLTWEVEVYVRRHRIPADRRAFPAMRRVMFDTFFRHPFVPLGQRAWNEPDLAGCTVEANPDATDPNTWLGKRLRDWAEFLPGRVYVHENLMLQGLLTVQQHNTGVHLRDLRTYRDLGVQGVCYEAYEPGFEHVADQITRLAAALFDLDSAADYVPTPLETELTSGRWKMNSFCDDPAFPLDRYLPDPVVRTHVRNYALFRREKTAAHLRALVNHVFEHADRFDPLFAGFLACQQGVQEGRLDFSGASVATQRLLCYEKLWDFMEDLPADSDPRATCHRLLADAVEHVRDRR